MKFLLTTLIVVIGLVSSFAKAESSIRPEAEYLVLYKEAVTFLKTKGIDVEPGVYLSPRELTKNRTDLSSLIGGGKWTNIFDENKPALVAGYAPGTQAGTGNEIWAVYNGYYFLLKDQEGLDQRIALGVPRKIIPALDGVFLVAGNYKVAFVAHSRNKKDKISVFNAPAVHPKSVFQITDDGQGLVYFAGSGNSAEAVLVKRDGTQTNLAKTSVTDEMIDGAVSDKGVFFKSGADKVSFLALAADGKPGTAKQIFDGSKRYSVAFRNNAAIAEGTKASGGNAFFYIGADGTLSEALVGGAAPGKLQDEAKTFLEKYAENWSARAEMGGFDALVERKTYVANILSLIKSRERTWVNVVAPFGAGKSELLKLVAKELTLASKQGGEWEGYTAFHMPLSAILNLQSLGAGGGDPAAPGAPPAGGAGPKIGLNIGGLGVGPGAGAANESPWKKIVTALTQKKVILFMDDFLDDPALGATNPGQSINLFLKEFREHTTNGNLRVITSSTDELWYKLVESSPELPNIGRLVKLAPPDATELKTIVEFKLKSVGKAFKVDFDPNIASIIIESAKQLSPDVMEPLRSTQAVENLARTLGSTAKDAKVIKISLEQARTYFFSKTLDTEKLEKIKSGELRQFLEDRVLGQSEALNKIVPRIASLSLGIEDQERPLTTLFLVGPTGTGKSYSAGLLAEYLELPVVTINMNFFEGFSANETFTKQIKKLSGKPYILVLDDIDKSPNATSVLSRLREVFDNGIYAQGTENELSLRNAILVITGNYGSKVILDNPSESTDALVDRLRDYVLSEDAPENERIPAHVWSRIENSIVIYKPLGETELKQIANQYAAEIDSDIRKRFGIKVVIDAKLIQNMVYRSATQNLGAVPIGNAIRNELRDKIKIYLSDLQTNNREQFKKVKEVFATVNSEDEVQVLDNTHPQYSAIRGATP